MNSRNIVLSGALIALVMLVTTNLFFASAVVADSVGTGVTPGSSVSVYMIKKAALICDNGASAPEDQFPPQIGGCVDNLIGDTSLQGSVPGNRYNQYLFSGEQLAELVVARDLSGAQFLSPTANMLVNGTSAVTCTQIDPANLYRCVGLTEDDNAFCAGATQVQCNANPTRCAWKEMWYGHDISALLQQLPPRQSISDPTGFNSNFDKLYNCLLTVTPQMTGCPVPVSVSVQDNLNSNLNSTSNPQAWCFNPAISIDPTFSDQSGQIQFPNAVAGQTVYSTNTLMIKNTADGGVDLAVYLVGHDLIDTTGTGICPSSNVLDVNNLAYRCKVGTFLSEQFTPLQHIKTSAECMIFDSRHCLVAPGENNLGPTNLAGYNDLLPDAASAMTSILYNGHTAECWFQLNVPIPCVGSYSASNAVEVLVRAL